jgi:hypothetical protein
MNRKENLTKQTEGCSSKAVSIFLGRAMLDEKRYRGALKNSTKTLNRHGLTGATGIRKQNYSSFISINCQHLEFCPDITYKKDFSGISKEGEKKLFIIEGHANINISTSELNSIVITDAIQTARSTTTRGCFRV